MASGRIIIPNYMPALDLNGGPVAGAKIYFYLNETTTLQSVYADEALTTPHTNPVVADADGVFPTIFADITDYFTVALTDANGAPIGGLRNYDGIQAAESTNFKADLDGSNVEVDEFRENIGALGSASNLADVSDVREARENLNLGERASVLDFVTDPAIRSAIASGTLAVDVSDAIEAAFASLPASGGILYMPGHYRSTRTVNLSGKSLTILGDGRQGSSWTAAHGGDLFQCIQTEVTQRVEFRGVQARSVSATGSRAVAKITWPLVASYGYCNFVTDDVEIQGNAAYSATNANSFQFGFDLKGAWQPTILRTTYFGAAPLTIATGPRPDSAYLRIDNCFGLNVARDCIVLYAGDGILQVGYSEGIYDLGQYIGCGYGIRTDPSCPVGPSGRKSILVTPAGEYNCFSGCVLLDTTQDVNVSDAANFGRWGDSGQDWTAIDLIDVLGAQIPGVFVNAPPSAGKTSWGVRSRVVSGFGAGVVVEGTRFANATHAVEFGPLTSRSSVSPTTTSTGAFGPDNFSDLGNGNVLAWRGSNTWILSWLLTSVSYADDAAAAAGGVPMGGLYRTGSSLSLRVA